MITRNAFCPVTVRKLNSCDKMLSGGTKNEYIDDRNRL